MNPLTIPTAPLRRSPSLSGTGVLAAQKALSPRSETVRQLTQSSPPRQPRCKRTLDPNTELRLKHRKSAQLLHESLAREGSLRDELMQAHERLAIIEEKLALSQEFSCALDAENTSLAAERDGLANRLADTERELEFTKLDATQKNEWSEHLATELKLCEAELRAARVEAVLHELSREKGVALTLEAELGEGGFGHVVAVSFSDPHSGAHRTAAAKIADTASAMDQLFNDAASLQALAAEGCTAAVPLVLGDACELRLPGGKSAAAYLMERAKGSLVDECDAMLGNVAEFETMLSKRTSEAGQACVVDCARGTWQALLDCNTAFQSNFEAINALGMLHSDVKPGNSLVMPDGRVLACDFGTALREKDAARGTIEVAPGVEVSAPLWSMKEQVIATTADYEQPEELRMDPAHISFSFDSWAAMLSVMEMVGLGPKELLGANDDLRYRCALADAIRNGSIGDLVLDTLLDTYGTCPEDIASGIAQLVERSAATHHCFGRSC